MTVTDPNAFLMSGGAKAFKFTNIGDAVRGKIIDLTMQQQRDPKNNKPLYWDDGNPRMQLRVILETQLSEGPDDDGHRAVYVRGQMQAAVRDAVKAAGAQKIEEGGVLGVKFESSVPTGLDPQKIFKAKYEAPVPVAASVDVDDF